MTKTVYIVGAGASKEVDMPLGAELKNNISRLPNFKFDRNILLKGDADVVQAINIKHSAAANDVAMFQMIVMPDANRIIQALPLKNSIDDLIDSYRENQNIILLGKLAIVKAILEAEKKSTLYLELGTLDKRFLQEKLGATWFIRLFRSLTEGCSRDDLPERLNRASFIIFNYDRCVEQFLFDAMRRAYGFDEIEAADLLNQLEIYHPYGLVGYLPWMKKSPSMNYGQVTSGKDFLNLADSIRTYSEGTDESSSNIAAIKNCIEKADRLIFLGFAYHRLNMKLLSPEDKVSKGPNFRVYASAFDISSHDEDAIKIAISELYDQGNPINISTAKEKCFEFFGSFQRSLGY